MNCHFCERSEDDCTILLAGPWANICDRCVALSVRVIVEQAAMGSNNGRRIKELEADNPKLRDKNVALGLELQRAQPNPFVEITALKARLALAEKTAFAAGFIEGACADCGNRGSSAFVDWDHNLCDRACDTDARGQQALAAWCEAKVEEGQG